MRSGRLLQTKNYLPRKRFWWPFCPLGDYYKTCSPSSCGWRAGGEPREARYSAKSSLYNENIYNNIIDNDINNILRRAPCTIQLGLIVWFWVFEYFSIWVFEYLSIWGILPRAPCTIQLGLIVSFWVFTIWRKIWTNT